jgi:hypothetical protein
MAGYKSAAPAKMRDAFRYFLLPNRKSGDKMGEKGRAVFGPHAD